MTPEEWARARSFMEYCDQVIAEELERRWRERRKADALLRAARGAPENANCEGALAHLSAYAEGSGL